ncbi:MAG TPA: hypothetical protein VM427_04435 [Patescibacteria group bacterium]|nr:hypothetical protein [Patescibacteria group bacterium]
MDALPLLAPIGADYASRPIAEAFNWHDAASDLGDGEWYLVAFRSIRKAAADEARLNEFDERAHLEAAAALGFVHYFKGPAAADGSCLSFCLWQTRADARAAAGRPDHVRAVSLIDEMYERYTLEFHRVTRHAGGALAFEPYDRVPATAVPVVPALELDAVDLAIDGPSPLLPSQPAISF